MTITEIKSLIGLKWIFPWNTIDDYSEPARIIEELGSLKCKPFTKMIRF